MRDNILTKRCSICAEPISDGLSSYPNAVCKVCGRRALNSEGKPARHYSEIVVKSDDSKGKPRVVIVSDDDGDNPVFIDGIKCRRRYRFGGWVTMRDKEN